MEILVFSKNRPMQLHGYLESLLRFSEIDPAKISVLYTHSDNVPYNKVIYNFPEINWIQEIDFDDQLRDWVNTVNDEYVMFGCDDVVFKNRFNIEEIEDFLSDYSNIFGFSLRLGTNITGFPENADLIRRYKNNTIRQYWIWNWKSDEIDDFHYPWELDCTIYRIEDVKSIVNYYFMQPIINPNDFEDIGNRFKLPFKWSLSCYNCPSQAFVITVNRVQETHLNPVDERYQTDVELLSHLYNDKNYTMNINKISAKGNTEVHVNADYLILKPEYDFKEKTNEK